MFEVLGNGFLKEIILIDLVVLLFSFFIVLGFRGGGIKVFLIFIFWSGGNFEILEDVVGDCWVCEVFINGNMILFCFFVGIIKNGIEGFVKSVGLGRGNFILGVFCWKFILFCLGGVKVWFFFVLVDL